jgi:CheY-like chemotaxis protein
MADVAYFVRDMLFTSKIREVANQLGVKVQAAPDPVALVRAAAGARLVIVDLRLDRALEALDALRADPQAAAVPSVGFVDHEKVEVMDAARARGCREVMAKGQFAKALPRLMAPP